MKTTDAARGASDGLAGGLEHVRSDLSSLRRDVAHLMSEGARRAGDRASEGADAVGDRLHALAGGGRASVQEAYGAVSEFVGKRPAAAVAIALGIGAIALGFCWLRARKD